MNLTEALNKACNELKRMHRFKGLPIIEVRIKSADERRKEAIADEEMTLEEIEEWIDGYVCWGVHLDTYSSFEFGSSNEYVSSEFDWGSLEKDFKAFLLPFLDGDASLIPKNLDLEGGDNEFMKPKFQSPPFEFEETPPAEPAPNSKHHQRKCWDCGNIAVHTDNIVPQVLCKQCGSQDTRRVKEEGPKPGLTVTSVFGESRIAITDGMNRIELSLTRRGVESLIDELQTVLELAD